MAIDRSEAVDIIKQFLEKKYSQVPMGNQIVYHGKQSGKEVASEKITSERQKTLVIHVVKKDKD